MKIFISKTLFCMLATFWVFGIINQHAIAAKEGKVIPFFLKQDLKKPKVFGQQFENQVEKRLFEKTLKIRKQQRLRTFKFSELLFEVAKLYSKDMQKRNFFSHDSPEKTTVLDRIKAKKLDYNEDCAENLHMIGARNGLQDAEAVARQMIDDWMHSESHKKNLLSQSYGQMAIGCSTDGKVIFCTQIFSGP